MPVTSYTDALADRILADLARGRRLLAISRDPDMPSRATMRWWIATNHGGFGDRYRELAHPRSRPPSYDRATSERFCAELRMGRTMQSICGDPGMPTVKTVLKWLKEDTDGFAARYRTAREIGYFVLADEILDIADNAGDDGVTCTPRRAAGTRQSVAHSRLRIVTRIWILSKMLPRALGKGCFVTLPGEDTDATDTLTEVFRQIGKRS